MVIVSSIERLSSAFGLIAVILVAPLIGALVYEVFSRYALGEPTFWAFEVSYMLMGTIFLLSMAAALRERLHVNVDFLHAVLPRRVRAVFDLIGYTIFIVAVSWLSLALFETSLESLRIGEVSGKSAWNPVVWPFKAVWFLGFVVLGLQVCAEIAKALISLWTGEAVEERR